MIMDGLTLIVVSLGGLLTIFLVATLLTLPFRLRQVVAAAAQEEALPLPKESTGGEGSWQAILFSHLARPLAVLLITGLVVALVEANPGILGGFTLNDQYLKAWYLFWLAWLFFNGNEALGRLYYTVRRRRFPVPGLILFLVRLLLVIAILLSIFHFVLDFDTSKLFTSTAVVAAVLGIALREVLSNFLSGVSMNLVGTVEPAQWIVVGDKEGEIIQRNWRETRLRTTGGHIWIIPNGLLAGSMVHNMTWPTPLRRHQMTVPLMFNASPSLVRSALVEAALSVAEVDRSKLPDAYVYEYRDYGMVYQLRYWSRTYFDRTRIEGMVRERVWYQLRRHGLEIPFPHGGDLNVGERVTNLTVMEDPVERCGRLLRESGFLEKLFGKSAERVLWSQEVFRLLATGLVVRVYGAGEVLFSQGEVGRVCYVLVRGRLLGVTRYEGMAMTQEFILDPGELVGEIALMTGLPRSSTIQAYQGEVEVLEFSRELFDRFMDHPMVSDAVSILVAERSRQFFEELRHLEPEQQTLLLSSPAGGG
ncbi:MAG: mechanosensitive ion channel [Magnetococcales bacterium]|nr:mechanosensitive ion channel [Magnetococcales bacterium]NGZ06095.1 mechanosensitive ion channel [Magnetococcales bacterium]